MGRISSKSVALLCIDQSVALNLYKLSKLWIFDVQEYALKLIESYSHTSLKDQ